MENFMFLVAVLIMCLMSHPQLSGKEKTLNSIFLQQNDFHYEFIYLNKRLIHLLIQF